MSLSCCGTDCSICACYGNLCKGCNESMGKVFHAPEGRACAIYECALGDKKVESCGKCGEVPCAVWRSTRDPQFSDEEFEKNICERIGNLRTYMTEKA